MKSLFERHFLHIKMETLECVAVSSRILSYYKGLNASTPAAFIVHFSAWGKCNSDVSEPLLISGTLLSDGSGWLFETCLFNRAD